MSPNVHVHIVLDAGESGLGWNLWVDGTPES